jgi:hypothetical protein
MMAMRPAQCGSRWNAHAKRGRVMRLLLLVLVLLLVRMCRLLLREAEWIKGMLCCSCSGMAGRRWRRIEGGLKTLKVIQRECGRQHPRTVARARHRQYVRGIASTARNGLAM